MSSDDKKDVKEENGQEKKDGGTDESAAENKEKETSENINVRPSNVDLVLPPCELETMFAKGLLMMPKNDLPKIASTLISPVEMELTELRVKVICLEKNTAAMKLELRCAELQVEAKEKVDKQKTRLIELLDAKVASLEKKNNTLIDMVEGLIKEKEARSTRLIDATKSMESLSNRLVSSERMKRELKNSNEELKSMLNNVEAKGSQIAKLAKEKIIKYKDENTRIQGELNDMKQLQENSLDLVLSWNHLDYLGNQLNDKLTAAKSAEMPEASSQILLLAGDINNEIRDKVAQMKAETSATITKFAASNEKLLTEVNQLKQSIIELQTLSDKISVQSALTNSQSTTATEECPQ